MVVASVPASSAGLRIFSKLVSLSVLVLIFVGALVTSYQAGLSVPDWPTTYGDNMFLFPYHKWIGGIFWEHSHRLIASFVGLLTVVLFVWTLLRDKRRWMKVLTGCALLAVIVQGILGGLTVLYLLPAWLSTSHAVLAQTFLGLTVIIAYAHGNEKFQNPCSTAQSLFKLSVIGVGVVYAQLFIGAYMRHTYSGLAIPDFPTMGGFWIPRFDAVALTAVNEQLAELGQWTVSREQMIIHFLHRLGGVVVAVFFFYLVARLLRTSDLPRPLKSHAKLLLGMVVLQFVLGVLAVLTVKEPVLTSVHVVLGALFLAFAVLLAARLFSLRDV